MPLQTASFKFNPLEGEEARESAAVRVMLPDKVQVTADSPEAASFNPFVSSVSVAVACRRERSNTQLE